MKEKCIDCEVTDKQLAGCELCADNAVRCLSCHKRHMNKLHKRAEKPEWTESTGGP